MTPDDDFAAHHEAGHAVAAVSFRLHFTAASLDARDGEDFLARVRDDPRRPPGRETARRHPELAFRRVVTALAGPESERHRRAARGDGRAADPQAWWREDDGPEAAGRLVDRERAETLLAWIHNPLSDEEAHAYLEAALHRTRVLVEAWRPVVGAVARSLLKRGRLAEEEVKALCWQRTAR